MRNVSVGIDIGRDYTGNNPAKVECGIFCHDVLLTLQSLGKVVEVDEVGKQFFVFGHNVCRAEYLCQLVHRAIFLCNALEGIGCRYQTVIKFLKVEIDDRLERCLQRVDYSHILVLLLDSLEHLLARKGYVLELP